MRDLIDLMESAMHLQQDGMGMHTWHNEDVIITGGMRAPLGAPEGFARLMYMLLHAPTFHETNDFEAAQQGKVTLFVGANHNIGGLIDIKLDPKKRKQGMGAATVRALAETAGHDITIVDIQKSALGFWKKMGCEFYTENQQPVANLSAFNFKGSTLIGVIRSGTHLELSQMPGFRKNRLTA